MNSGNAKNIPILMYHHVVPAGQVSQMAPFAVSLELFSRQLDVLQARGFQTLTLSGFFDLQEVGGKASEVGRPVAITFDDCPAALLEFAVPELLRRGMTATFFAVAGKLGGSNDWDEAHASPIPLMTAANLSELAANGFEIGSHGMHHLHLRKCPLETIAQEMSASRQCLQEITGQSVDFFAYPFGEYPAEYAGQCRAAGYRGAVSIFSPSHTVAADRYCIRRILVHEGDHPVRFGFKLGQIYSQLRYFVDQRIVGAVGHD